MDYYKILFEEEKNIVEYQSIDFYSFLELNDEKPNWYINLEKCLIAHDIDEYNMALPYINKAIEEMPSNSHLYDIKANTLEKLLDFDGAIIEHKNSLIISREDRHTTYDNLGMCFLNLKDYLKAKIAFDISINIKLINNDHIKYPEILDRFIPNIKLEHSYVNRASALLGLSEYQECVNDCTKATELDPEYSNAYFILGMVYLMIEESNNASHFFRIADSLGHKKAKSILNQFC
jgi:tetratricopeptide (TPR) repeat protein